MEEKQKNTKSESGTRRKRSWPRMVLLFVLVLIALLFSISILSNNDSVQKWYGTRISEYLSSRTGHPINMGVTDASIWRGLVIHDILVQDLNGDQMLKIAEIETSLRKNLFSIIFHKKVNLENIKIIDAEININTIGEDKYSNLQKFIGSFSKQSDKKGKCTDIDLKKLDLLNVNLSLAKRSVKQFETHIERARIQFNKIDLCNKVLDIEEIFLSNSLLAYDGTNNNPISSEEPILSDSIIRDTFDIVIDHFLMDQGQLILKSGQGRRIIMDDEVINFNDIHLTKFDLETREISFNTGIEGSLKIDQLSFEEKSGFKLERFSVETVNFNNRETELIDVSLATEGSTVRNDINFSYNSYASFKEFKDKIFLDIRIKDSNILPQDLFYFYNSLSKNDFFVENRDEIIQLDGRISGRLNNLKGRDINIILEEHSSLQGNFSSRNLLVKGEQLMNIRLKEFRSNTTTLSKLLPGIEFSPSFLRLGELNFKGAFDGYFHDFVAFGSLDTDLGPMNMDMRLNLSNGAPKAEYSGNLAMRSFNLGKFTDAKDLGNISASARIINGRGLNINTVSANLKAVVDSLEFKGHTYENLVMDGYLDKYLFNGDFAIEEDHIDIDLTGIVNYGDSIPVFDFDAAIRHLDLHQLNIVKNPLLISSNMKINLKGRNLEDIEGNLKAKDLVFSNNDKKIKLDSVLVSSKMSTETERYIDLSSEIISFYFDGKFQLNKIPDAIIDVLKTHYPDLMRNIPHIDTTAGNPNYYYDFYIYVPKSKNLFEIIQPLPANIEELVISGHVNHALSHFDINSSFETLELADMKINQFKGSFDMKGPNGTVQIEGENLYYKNNKSDSLFFNAQISKKNINYNFRMDTLNEKLKDISFDGNIKPHDKGYENNIFSGKLTFVDETWYFNNQNTLVFGPKYIDLENFSLINNQYTIAFEDFNDNQGLKAIISGLDMSIVNAFWENDFLQFSGGSEGFILFPSIFENRIFEGAIRVKDFKINDDPYGEISSLIQLDTQNSTVLNINGTVTNGTHIANAIGGLNLSQRTMDLKIDFDKFPVSFLEYIVKDGISRTAGYGSGNLHLTGPFEDLDINGEAMVFEGKTKIDYLGVNYFFDQQKVKLTKNKIDFTGIVIQDKVGNKGTVNGGINHRQFKDLTLDINMKSPRMTALNTTKLLNPQFYGRGIGSANVRFTGPISSPNISVDAEVFQGSHLTIPVSSQTEVSESSFIKFNDENSINNKPKNNGNGEISGVNLDMNLSIQQGAEVKIILSEIAGDNIQGTGTGDIRLEITRTGGFEMYGNLYIDRGTYLFTALTLIQKPFSIRQGGKITWTGDPLDAKIDLLADYQGERVALDNFIKEYTISNPSLAQKARKRTDVDLLLHLTGSLLHPEVSFDLSFPNLDGDIKSYVYSKLQKLRSDQNLMYTQAITLLSLGAFLPQDNIGGLNESNVSAEATTIQVGLQYTAVLLSKYLSGLLEELFNNSSWISGIDIDINAINSQVIADVKQDNFLPNEYTYDAELHLFDEKASIEFNGSYVNKGIIDPNTSYANGDVIFKYFVTEDRKLRIEAYSKREYEEYFNEWKWKIGLGLNYQLKFGSIYDMKKDIERDIKKREAEGIQ